MNLECNENDKCIVLSRTSGEVHKLYLDDYLWTAFAELRELFAKDASFSQMYNLMREICVDNPNAYLCGHIEQGSTYKHLPKEIVDKGFDYGRDRWEDGMSWETWISDSQVAKEFYARAKRRK